MLRFPVVVAGCSTHAAGPGPAPSSMSATGVPATRTVDVVAVDAEGRPANGYHEITGDQPVPD